MFQWIQCALKHFHIKYNEEEKKNIDYWWVDLFGSACGSLFIFCSINFCLFKSSSFCVSQRNKYIKKIYNWKIFHSFLYKVHWELKEKIHTNFLRVTYFFPCNIYVIFIPDEAWMAKMEDILIFKSNVHTFFIHLVKNVLEKCSLCLLMLFCLHFNMTRKIWRYDFKKQDKTMAIEKVQDFIEETKSKDSNTDLWKIKFCQSLFLKALI